MSDDDIYLNNGFTLPDDINATYNAGLMPLFYERNGFSRVADQTIIVDGREGFLWTSTVNHSTSTFPYYMSIGESNIAPSSYNSTVFGLSLRCLVSTNNE